MEPTNAAVLAAVGEQVVSPDVLEAAVDRAPARLTTRRDGEETKRLRAERRALDEELSRLTAALASSGTLASVVGAIRAREVRRAALDERLAGVEQLAALPKLDRRKLRDELRRRVADWRAPLGRHVAQARQLLRKVLVERLTVTPEAGVERQVIVTGDGTLLKLLAGIVFPKGVASPSIPSWNRLLAWLRDLEKLRETGVAA